MREVSEFVVVLPTKCRAGGALVERVRATLERAFPHYRFRLTDDGPMQDEEEFQVLPIMGAVGEGADPDEVYLCKPLDPMVIPQILDALKAPVLVN